MGTKLSLCTFLLILLPLFGHAQYVYGDKSTKKYYSIECGEVAKISQGNTQGFKSAADAEKAGFTKGETCTPSTMSSAPIVSGRIPALKKRSNDTILVRDLRKDSVTLEMIETEFSKYRGGVQKFVGEIRVSGLYFGKYEIRQRDMWAFHLCDSSSCGEFYMAKTIHSDNIRAVLMNPSRDKDLIWTCQYQPEQLVLVDYVIGELISCEYRYIVE